MASPKYSPTCLNGTVEFAIPGVSHPSFGEVTVSGKYLRIHPHHSRPEVDPYIIQKLVDGVITSMESCGFEKMHHFQRFSLQTMATTAVQFGCYWFPEVALDSKEMEFIIWFLSWAWLYDDSLEEAWNNGNLHKGNVDSLKYFHETYLKIIRMQKIAAENSVPPPGVVEVFPDFHRICKCIQKMVGMAINLVGGNVAEYLKRIEFLAAPLESSFKCNEWYTVSRLNEGTERYSLPTYHAWRIGNAGADSVLEAVVFSKGVELSPEIRKHPAFHRMTVIIMNNVQWVNDVLGVRKDFGHGTNNVDPDNEIVFRVLNKGENIHSVVQETCARIGEELRDLILIKEALMDLFGEGGDEDLVRYLDIVDAFIDGQNQVYVENTRYRCKRGFVRLSRDDLPELEFCSKESLIN